MAIPPSPQSRGPTRARRIYENNQNSFGNGRRCPVSARKEIDFFSKPFRGPEGRLLAVEYQTTRLKGAGYQVLDRKGKDRGTRFWFLLRKGKRKFLALLILERHPTDGWVSEWRHEDDGFYRPNCPLSLLRSVGQRARTKPGNSWRKRAMNIMRGVDARLTRSRQLRKQDPHAWVRSQQVQALHVVTRKPVAFLEQLSDEKLQSHYLVKHIYIGGTQILHETHGLKKPAVKLKQSLVS